MKNKTNRLILHLAKKFTLVMGLLLLTQLLFFLANTRLFHLENMREFLSILWGNIRFGAAATALFLGPYLIMMLLPIEARWKKRYRTTAEILFWLGALILLLVNIVDMAYYQFTYRRMSAMMFRYMGVGGDMGNLIPKFLVDYWYATVSAIVVVTLLIVCCLRMRLRNLEGWGKPPSHTTPGDRRSRRQVTVHCIVGIMVVLILMRGGVGRQWIQPGEVVRYAQPKNSALVMNSAFNIVRTIGHLDVEEQDFMSPVAAQMLYPTHHEPLPCALNGSTTLDEAGYLLTQNTPTWMLEVLKNSATHGITIDSMIRQSIDSINRIAHPRRNVVLIILEGFSQEYMGCYNQGIMPSYTPFLDQLAAKSTCYQGRSNGKESIESIPAILASLPSWSLSPFILSPYYEDDFNSLPSLLKRHGYRSAMFHGGYNGSMNFDKFCHKAGFDHYFGMTEYTAARGNEAYDGVWGIFDEPFMQYSLEEIGNLPQPFFASIYTISAHHPYSLPEGYENSFLTGKHPILPTVAYSDYALQRFFEEAGKQPWYNNTLFVILADHPGPSLHREYNDYVGWYRIPMIFFDPANTHHPRMSNDVVQQIDVMPTLLDMLQIQEPAICFGNSVLRRNSDNHGHQIVFGNDFYQLERNGRLAIYSPYKTIGSDEDLEFLKAAIQEYNYKLIHNQLTR